MSVQQYTYEEVQGRDITVGMEVIIYHAWKEISEIYPSEERGMMVKYPTPGDPYHDFGLFILENNRKYTRRIKA